MTKEQKREKRRVRQELAAAVRKSHFSKDFKLCTTNRQWKSSTRRVVDQLLAGKNPQMAEKIFTPEPLFIPNAKTA